RAPRAATRPRAAEQRDELAAFHVEHHHIVPAAGCWVGCAGGGITPVSLGAATVLGTRIVKVDPRPGSLSSVMSPPIMRASLREMASPSPVPPKRCAVEASA